MQTSTMALAGTPTTTKRTRSHFACRQDPQDVDVQNFLEGSDSGNSADPHDSTDDDVIDDGQSSTNILFHSMLIGYTWQKVMIYKKIFHCCYIFSIRCVSSVVVFPWLFFSWTSDVVFCIQHRRLLLPSFGGLLSLSGR